MPTNINSQIRGITAFYLYYTFDTPNSIRIDAVTSGSTQK